MNHLSRSMPPKASYIGGPVADPEKLPGLERRLVLRTERYLGHVIRVHWELLLAQMVDKFGFKDLDDVSHFVVEYRPATQKYGGWYSLRVFNGHAYIGVLEPEELPWQVRCLFPAVMESVQGPESMADLRLCFSVEKTTNAHELAESMRFLTRAMSRIFHPSRLNRLV